MKIKIIFILCIFLTSISAYAEADQKISQATEEDNLKVHVSDISRVEYERALEHLQALENFIYEAKSVPDIVDSGRFYIGYPNSLVRIKGYVLYLEKELAKAQYEAAELKMKAGKINTQTFEMTKTKLKEAEKAFNDYLASSRFQD